MVTTSSSWKTPKTHLQVLAGLLADAGWRDLSTGQIPPASVEWWWDKLLTRDPLTRADWKALNYILHLRRAGIDMQATVSSAPAPAPAGWSIVEA